MNKYGIYKQTADHTNVGIECYLLENSVVTNFISYDLCLKSGLSILIGDLYLITVMLTWLSTSCSLRCLESVYSQ